MTPRGRPAARPHTARFYPARGELVIGDAWRALEQVSASSALVRFSGGGGRQGTLESVSVKAGGRELANWGAGNSELAGALAAPVWGRYGSFRGQLRIAATLAWNNADRSLLPMRRLLQWRFRDAADLNAAHHPEMLSVAT
ncbi:MAG: hypothetical protein ACLP0J_24935 [Solirubrobacteraceae bacterium]